MKKKIFKSIKNNSLFIIGIVIGIIIVGTTVYATIIFQSNEV